MNVCVRVCVLVMVCVLCVRGSMAVSSPQSAHALTFAPHEAAGRTPNATTSCCTTTAAAPAVTLHVRLGALVAHTARMTVHRRTPTPPNTHPSSLFPTTWLRQLSASLGVVYQTPNSPCSTPSIHANLGFTAAGCAVDSPAGKGTSQLVLAAHGGMSYITLGPSEHTAVRPSNVVAFTGGCKVRREPLDEVLQPGSGSARTRQQIGGARAHTHSHTQRLMAANARSSAHMLHFQGPGLVMVQSHTRPVYQSRDVHEQRGRQRSERGSRGAAGGAQGGPSILRLGGVLVSPLAHLGTRMMWRVAMLLVSECAGPTACESSLLAA